MVGQIQPANIFEAMNRGLEIGRRRRNENAFADAVSAHGVGSEQAVNALAALNPMGASQMAQQGRQFDARMAQDAEQFGAQMGLRREQFAADQAHRAATLSLQRQRLLIQRSNAARAASGAQGARSREVAAALLGQVLSMPEAERAQGYAVALQQAQAAGLSLENIPPEYPGGAAVTALYNVVSGKTWEGAAGPVWRATTPEEAAQYGRPGQINTETGQYKAGPGGGQTITMGKDGSVTFQQGGSPAGLGRAAQNDLDGRAVDAAAQLARLGDIQTQIAQNPALLEAQTLEGLAKRKGFSLAEWVGGEGTLSPEQKKYLTDVTQVRADMLANLNLTIKEITGAAMSAAEATRIIGTIPAPGDSPTEFVAKLNQALKRTRLALARYNHWRNGGFGDAEKPWTAAALEDIPRLINERGDAIAAELRAQGVEDSAIAAQVQRQLGREFGI